MKRKKTILADILFNSYLVNLFKRLPLRNRLIIFNYHRLKPADADFSTPFDEGVYTLDVDEFARQIEWLKKNTMLLSEQDLLLCCRDGVFTSPSTSVPCVVITFDDGYRDNYTLAYPILRSYEVPALLFVATHMINSRQLPWWDIIAYLIKHCHMPTLNFWGKVFPLGDKKQETITHLQLQMKNEPYAKTKYLLSDLSQACGVPLPPPELQDQEILTWEEIGEMAAHNISVGSHTHTHRVLSTLESVFQKEEMILSKLIIEEHLGREVKSIAYPVGELRYITAETAEIAAATGYLLGFTTNTGINDWRNMHAYLVKRVADLLDKVSTVSLMTVLPELFTWDVAASFQRRITESHPTYADLYYRLGIIQLGQGKIEEAIDNFTQAVHFNPNYTEARIKLGISQASLGRYEEAEKNFLTIIEKKPSFADVSYYLGLVYAGQGRISRAIDYLERALAINPSYRDVMLRLAVLYLKEERFERALTMLDKASKTEPADQDLIALAEAAEKIAADRTSSTRLVDLLSYYIGSANELDKLIAGFLTHMDISPNLSDIIAIVEKDTPRQENLEAMLLLLEDYREIFPQYSDIHYTLGVLYKKLGRRREAETSFNESLRLNPRYTKARLQLFNLLRELDRHQEALTHGLILAQADLPYPDLYYGLADTCLSLTQYPQAAHFAKKSLTLNPSYRKAQKIYQRIQALGNN